MNRPIDDFLAQLLNLSRESGADAVRISVDETLHNIAVALGSIDVSLQHLRPRSALARPNLDISRSIEGTLDYCAATDCKQTVIELADWLRALIREHAKDPTQPAFVKTCTALDEFIAWNLGSESCNPKELDDALSEYRGSKYEVTP